MRTLGEIYQTLLENRELTLKKFLEPEVREFFVGGYAVNGEKLGMCVCQLKNDFVAARKHFFEAAWAYLWTNAEKSTPLPLEMYCAVLSDSAEMRGMYAELDESTQRDVWSLISRTLQAWLRNDHAMTTQRLSLLDVAVTQSQGKSSAGYAMAFRGLLENDVSLVDDGLTRLLKNVRYLETEFNKEHFFLGGTCVAKLAMERGMVLQTKHHTIPEGMLPKLEISGYEKYDFASWTKT